MWPVTPYEELLVDLPKHGPGAVAEKFSSDEKFEAVLLSSVAEDFPELGYAFLEVNSGVKDEDRIGRTTSRVSKVAKLCSVPKNSTSRRTITIEPAVRMFVQQQLNLLMRRRIKTSPLCTCLSLDDQEPSRKWALVSSKTRSHATVDLKKASDSLALGLVKEVFAHDHLLLDLLLRSRTPVVMDGQRSYTLRKYAGMGNATTFPVQSVVFAALAVKTILVGRGLPPTRRNVMEAMREIRVYGDDIVIPCDVYDAFATELEAHGLTVNRAKSFARGWFRESCGCDSWMGEEITPVYVRHDLGTKQGATAIVSLLAASNGLWQRCWYSAAEYLRKGIEKAIGPLPLVRRCSAVVGLYDRYDTTQVDAWDKVLQRPVVFGRSMCVKKTASKLDGLAAVLRGVLLPTPSLSSLTITPQPYSTYMSRRGQHAA